MLRITRIADGDSVILKLEGVLLGPWVDELHAASSQADRRSSVQLDLSSVTFVDAAGIALLEDLQHRGCRIVACSRFIAALLHMEIS